MYASVVTWSINHPLDPASRRHLLAELLDASLIPARDAGAVDLLVLEIETDLIMTVTVYETLEEAFVAGPRELVAVAHRFADRLALISRVVGCAYDPPGFQLVPRTAAQEWREDAEAMYASLATWQIPATLRAPADLNGYLAQRMRAYLPQLQELGLLDLVVVRLADDVILVVHVYAEPAEVTAAFGEAIAATHRLLGEDIAYVKGHAGRAFDVPQLVGERA